MLALLIVAMLCTGFLLLALADLLRLMCLPRSIISMQVRDGLLQRNVIRPPQTAAAGGEINLRKLQLRPYSDRPCIDPKGLLRRPRA
jgi:hypothetical protein